MRSDVAVECSWLADDTPVNESGGMLECLTVCTLVARDNQKVSIQPWRPQK